MIWVAYLKYSANVCLNFNLLYNFMYYILFTLCRTLEVYYVYIKEIVLYHNFIFDIFSLSTSSKQDDKKESTPLGQTN